MTGVPSRARGSLKEKAIAVNSLGQSHGAFDDAVSGDVACRSELVELVLDTRVGREGDDGDLGGVREYVERGELRLAAQER
jgi:hypothetical protein